MKKGYIFSLILFLAISDFYIGKAQTTISARDLSLIKQGQLQNEIVVYSNSFESPADTVGWQRLGAMEFSNDAPPGGGNAGRSHGRSGARRR